jgi:hypothetical protein
MAEDNKGNILIYQNEKGDTRIDVYFQDSDIWMTQKSLAELYRVQIPTINEHIMTILTDGELTEDATIRNFLIVQKEGTRQVTRETLHYNFPMILAIGYRVRSHVGMHFRKWATMVLTEYSKKGFALNDERLKQPKRFGEDYYDELLERIRDIRASEIRVNEAIKKIYATSVDYDPHSQAAQDFFANVQNKMHFSVHGHTAAELIVQRADVSKPNMGLTSFKGAKVRKGDVDIAKNYLSDKEINELNRIVTMYLDYAEDQARKQIPMHMTDWGEKLKAFLQFTGRQVLQDSGNVSAEAARQLALQRYEQYDAHRAEQEDSIQMLAEHTRDFKPDNKD